LIEFEATSAEVISRSECQFKQTLQSAGVHVTQRSLRAREDAFSTAVIVPWQALQKARFHLEIGCGRTIELEHAGHYAFLERPPCGWSTVPPASP